MTDDYLAVNRRYWDSRAPAHAASQDFDLARFTADPDALSDVVAFDRPRLGDVVGLRALHLQCHIGTDTLSLSRLGAEVTGLDLSPTSITEARALAEASGATIEFVEADTYSAVEALGAGRFDLVYASVGTLLWLPDLPRWASVVAALLVPGGRLFIRDTHPMVGAFEVVKGRAVATRPYFTMDEPVILEGGVYIETDEPLEHLTTHEWTHGLGDTVNALIGAGLVVTSLEEHDSAPYEALDGLMEPNPDWPGEFRVAELPEAWALSFTLQAVKP